MDWLTVTVSAALSAVVSALVSLVAVQQVTVRRARAERADAARQAVRAAVTPLLNELARYEYLTARAEPKRSAQQSHMDDHAAVLRIRAAASDLPGWRRWLVDRRCRRVFGQYWTALAIEYPTETPGQGEGSFSAWLAAELQRSGDRPDRLQGRLPLDGVMHRAYSQRPGHPLLKKLRRELRQLAASR